MDEYQSFDTWCLIKGFDPLELPGYRFYHAALQWLRDDRDEESALKLESTLREADELPHPFHVPSGRSVFDFSPVNRTVRHIPASDSDELSLEEQKRREFAERAARAKEEGERGEAALKNKYRVPEWWLGEEQAYKSSKTAQMGTSSLPKFG